MASVVLKAFPWCPDGFTREDLAAGAVRDFGGNTAGLTAAGLIGPTGEQAPAPAEPVAPQAPAEAPTASATPTAATTPPHTPHKPNTGFRKAR